MKRQSKAELFLELMAILGFVSVVLLVIYSWLVIFRVKNATLKAIPASQTCTPIVTMEQLEQSCFQTDGDIFFKVGRNK